MSFFGRILFAMSLILILEAFICWLSLWFGFLQNKDTSLAILIQSVQTNYGMITMLLTTREVPERNCLL
jgi:hypothetical protein